MKKSAVILLLLIVSAAICAPIKDVSFIWEPNPPTDEVIAYHLYEKVGTNYVHLLEIPGALTTNCTLVGLEWPQGRTFVLTASNYVAESGYSDEAYIPGQPKAPIAFERN